MNALLVLLVSSADGDRTIRDFDSGASTDRQTPCSTRKKRRLTPRSSVCNGLRPKHGLTNRDIRCRIQKNGRCHFECSKSDRKSTRLNSSHLGISYAVFCLKK